MHRPIPDASRQDRHEPTFLIRSSTCRPRLCAQDVCSGDAGVQDRALAGYAAPLLGDGFGYITSSALTGATSSKAVYRIFGTLIGAAGTIVLVPNLVDAPELLSLAIALWVGIFPVFRADRRHAAQLCVHVGRLYHRTYRISGPLDAPIDLRRRGLPCAGNHAGNHLCERRFDARAATERRLCGRGSGGRLACQCGPALRGCPDRSRQRARSATTNACASPLQRPQSTSSAGISTMRPPLQRTSCAACSACAGTCWRCSRCSPRLRTAWRRSTPEAGCRPISERSAQGLRGGWLRAARTRRSRFAARGA